MITPTAYKIYQFIQQYLDNHPYAPSTTEIAHGVGLSSRGVISKYLKQLQDAGMIARTPGRHRNITLLPETANPIEKASVTPIKQAQILRSHSRTSSVLN